MSRTWQCNDLPAWYITKLDGMKIPQIAEEAARLRSSSPKRKGASTECIIHYVLVRRTKGDNAKFHYFLRIYARAWGQEKSARQSGERDRPSDRPVIGSRRCAQPRARLSFALR